MKEFSFFWSFEETEFDELKISCVSESYRNTGFHYNKPQISSDPSALGIDSEYPA